MPWEDSYLAQLRKIVGNRKLFLPGVRAIITDEQGRILLIRRRDNGRWAMPAGAMEIDESIFDALKREVKEETGLEVVSATPIAIYSEPRFDFVDEYNAEYKPLVLTFLVDEWHGTLVTETDETTDARFFSLDEWPDPELYREALEDFRKFDGRLIVK